MYKTLMMERKTKIAEVAGHLHKRILKLGEKDSLYLFCNQSFVTLNCTVDQLHSDSKEEDGILYLTYA
jgi:hypothetical protein